jgi:DNA mismatch repair protein MutL
MPDICRLTASVVNKIAAGEVIERPASVVKELLENAVDSGATRIDLTVEKGGVDLVRVTDNGCGIAADQLFLAVAAHATSKIRDADDLFRIGTLGFRGEALASIAEVSRLALRSRTADSEVGAELEVVGGEMSPVAPCGGPPGTMVEVHNLFFNTPVRRKFLRATQTEMGHTTEAFTRLALAYPDRHFTLRHGEKLVYDLPPGADRLARIAAFFGADLAADLISIESRDGPVRLSGYVANPSQSRGNQRTQYLFLNGRAIRDRALQHALQEAYRGLLLTGRYPVAFLEIEMPADAVDVNVHPTKMEVRFQDGGQLYSQLLGTLRTRFLTTDLTARFRGPGTNVAAGQQVSGASAMATVGAAPSGVTELAGDPTGAHDAESATRMREELVRWAKGELASQSAQAPGGSHAASAAAAAWSNETALAESTGGRLAYPSTIPRSSGRPLELVPIDRQQFGQLDPQRPRAPTHVTPPPASHYPSAAQIPGPAGSIPPTANPFNARNVAMQVHDRYLIAETDEGVMVIDQHALHERVLYEQLREKILAGALETQRLLIPEPVDLGPAESAAALADRELLAKLGIAIEPFGGGTLLVTSYPAMLARLRPADVLRLLVEQLVAGGKAPDRRDMLDEMLHMMSCKAAVKAGDRLTPEEVEALVAQRHLAQDSHHCPHGRPTVLVFTRDELDRQFKRT